MQVTNPAPALAKVYQKECVISKSTKMVTSSFGGCYVLTGHDPETKYSFLAHIDDTTNVASICQIFSTLKGLGVDVQRLTSVRLMGGYQAHTESNAWGQRIIEVLRQEGLFGKIDFTYFQKKVEGSFNHVGDHTHFFGGQLDPQTGGFSFFKTIWMKLEVESEAKSHEVLQSLCAQKGINLSGLSKEQISVLAGHVLMDLPEVTLKVTVV
jgi:hypothetical protein